MSWKEHTSVNLEEHSVAIVMVSDSLFSGSSFEKDKSSPIAFDILTNAGINHINIEYFPDDFTALKFKIEQEIQTNTSIIILIGGTGIHYRDVSYEAVTSVVQKQIPGFGEEFRRRSYDQVKGMGLLSRTVAGVRKKSLILCIPGSPKAVKVGLELLLEFAGHVLQLLNQ